MSDVAIDAPEPFHSTARGVDLVLHSCDRINFYVVKAFLVYASPVFEDMCSIPKPSEDTIEDTLNGHPIIAVAEESKYLRFLLLLCYPKQVSTPAIDNFEDLVNTATVAKKYCMNDVERYLVGRMKQSAYIAKDPIRVFDLSLQHNWEEVGKAAVRASLRTRESDLPIPTEETYMNGLDLCHLFQYRHKCARAIRDWVRDNINKKYLKVWPHKSHFSREQSFCWWSLPGETLAVENHNPNIERNCNLDSARLSPACLQKGERSVNISGRRWWAQYFILLLEELEFCPCGHTVLDERLSEFTLKNLGCDICTLKAKEDLEVFKQRLASKIDDIVSEVPLNVRW